MDTLHKIVRAYATVSTTKRDSDIAEPMMDQYEAEKAATNAVLRDQPHKPEEKCTPRVLPVVPSPAPQAIAIDVV